MRFRQSQSLIYVNPPFALARKLSLVKIGRRKFLLGSAMLAAGWAVFTTPRAATGPVVRVYKTATCGCCGGWVDHMKSSGFEVLVTEVPDVTPYRRQLGVPDVLGSCHTAEVGGYAIEGHVPGTDVRRLLREKPKARGLAVPGMVPGSPGMGGAPVAYQTLVFDSNGRYTVFERH